MRVRNVAAITALTAGALTGATMTAGAATITAPTAPPVTWCTTPAVSPYTTAPAGAITVPAGDNSAVNFAIPNKTYWFASGTHTIGTGQYDQIDPAKGDTYIGAPGAILDGQGVNQYAFIGQYNSIAQEDVTIDYLTIQNFAPTQGGGAVNGNGNNGWTEEYDTMKDNTPGAALMLGGHNTVENNCLTSNGEYGFQGFSWVDANYSTNFTGGALHIVLSDNEISYNNTQGTESGIEGGGKFWQDGDVTVENNYVHDNDGPGLWLDTDNAGFLIQGNYITDNAGEGLMYEISYNGLVQDNYFAGNGIKDASGAPGFPTGAIYVSESGGASRVPSTYSGSLKITANVFDDNQGGVVIYQNANRYSGDGQDPGTLVPPKGETSAAWVNDGMTMCPDNLAETSPVNYHWDCQWRAQNITVANNSFTFNPADPIYGGECTVDNNCGQNGLFSEYSSTPAYPAYSVCKKVANGQNNHFKDNTYTGPWTFVAFCQGDTVSQAKWQAGGGMEGGSFNAQDAGSTFNS